MRPVIGLSAATMVLDNYTSAPLLAARRGYFDLILSAGGWPVMLPYLQTEDQIKSYMEDIDGLLLTGGGDVDPIWYAENKHELTGKFNMDISHARDWTEFQLMKYLGSKPVLGICRGLQIINIFAGGSLTQHLQVKSETHLPQEGYAGLEHNLHQIELVSDTLLGKWAQEADEALTQQVNSGHHQAVDRLGLNLQVAARSIEGVVEAIVHSKHPFMLGVQWHPENMPNHWLSQRLAQEFVRQAAAGM